MKKHCGPGPLHARVLPAEEKHQFDEVHGVLAHVLPQIAHDTSRPKKWTVWMEMIFVLINKTIFKLLRSLQFWYVTFFQKNLNFLAFFLCSNPPEHFSAAFFFQL